MKIASMVPSWTETLIAAGANVVARTRYCIHPATAKAIASVGGTKDLNFEKLAASGADLLILDREENPLSMAEFSPIGYWASHIESAHDMPGALDDLAALFRKGGDLGVAQNLDSYALRWRKVLTSTFEIRAEPPALIDWWRKPPEKVIKTVYLIWKDPFMAAGRNTFIGSMLALLGFELETFASKYPEIELSHYDKQDTLLLFSSEPYPFAKFKTEITALGFASALVDGESVSWFGLRSLEFLESLQRG